MISSLFQWIRKITKQIVTGTKFTYCCIAHLFYGITQAAKRSKKKEMFTNQFNFSFKPNHLSRNFESSSANSVDRKLIFFIIKTFLRWKVWTNLKVKLICLGSSSISQIYPKGVETTPFLINKNQRTMKLTTQINMVELITHWSSSLQLIFTQYMLILLEGAHHWLISNIPMQIMWRSE